MFWNSDSANFVMVQSFSDLNWLYIDTRDVKLNNNDCFYQGDKSYNMDTKLRATTA